MSDAESDRRRVFWNAARLALRDGQLSNGEKRILVKLAHALRLDDDEPTLSSKGANRMRVVFWITGK